MKHRVLVAFIFLTLVFGHAFAQDRAELDGLDEKLTRYFEKKMPDWKNQRGQPIAGSGDNVLIQVWSFSNIKIKVSILLHKSVVEAQQVMQNHARYALNKETLTGLGDEAYASGWGATRVAFRRGKFTVYLLAGADIDADPTARSLNQEQRFEREKSETRRWSREFAKYLVNAMDAP